MALCVKTPWGASSFRTLHGGVKRGGLEKQRVQAERILSWTLYVNDGTSDEALAKVPTRRHMAIFNTWVHQKKNMTTAGSSKGALESRIPIQNNHHCLRKTKPIPKNVHPPLNHRSKWYAYSSVTLIDKGRTSSAASPGFISAPSSGCQVL